MTTQLLIENLTFAEAQVNEDGTVRQVLIKAGRSANGRHYSESVLQAAVGMFEGARTYNGHPTAKDIKERRERTPLELTGWISNVRYEEGALVGQRHFAATDAGEQSRRLIGQVVKGEAPASLIGASINAFGKATKQETKEDSFWDIESIEGVYSVDDVVSPAAGGGFPLAASTGQDLVGMLLEHLNYDEWVASRPEYAERLIQANRKVRRNAQLEQTIQARDKYRTRFEDAQAELARLQETHTEAAAMIERLRREVLVVETLAGIRLPAEWKAGLRADLLEADPGSWQDIINREIQKARRVDAIPKPKASGQGVQVAEAVNVPQMSPLTPLPTEDAAAWWARVRNKG